MLPELEYVQSPNYLLRKVTPETYASAFETLNEEQLLFFFGHKAVSDIDKEKKRLEGGLQTFNKKLLLFHILDPQSRANMGWCGYHTWYVDHRRAEIGYMLSDDSYKRKGIVSEVLPVVIRYGFEQLNLNRIEAFVSPTNIPSLRLLEKNGFKQEGYLRQHYQIPGKIDDSVLFALLREEVNRP